MDDAEKIIEKIIEKTKVFLDKIFEEYLISDGIIISIDIPSDPIEKYHYFQNRLNSINSSFNVLLNHEIPEETLKKVKIWHSKFLHEIDEIKPAFIEELSEKIIKFDFEKVIDKFKITGDWDLFAMVADKLINLHPQEKNAILQKIETIKMSLFKTNYTKGLQSNHFGLLPITKNLKIEELSRIVWPDKKIKSLKEFADIANAHKIDVIHCIKFSKINYDIMDLLDYKTSKDFEILHPSTDGITKETVQRYNNIRPLKSHSMRTSQKFLTKNDAFSRVFVIEQISTDLYRFLGFFFVSSCEEYSLEKTSIREFIGFVMKTHKTKIEDMNRLMDTKITKNMVLMKPAELDFVREKSNIISPKYLKAEILKQINDAFLKKMKGFKSGIYEYNKIATDPEYEMIFGSVLTKSYHDYTFDKADFADKETFALFIAGLSVYRRDFRKKLVDYFVLSMKFIRNNIDDNVKLQNIFTENMENIVNSLITNNLNIYNVIHFAANLHHLNLF